MDGELKSALANLDLEMQAKEQKYMSISTDFGKITHIHANLFEVLHAHRIRVREWSRDASVYKGLVVRPLSLIRTLLIKHKN